MCKEIDSRWFFCDDQFIKYAPVDEFDEESREDAGIGQFSAQGQDLRKSASYFVIGDKTDQFILDELDITKKRQDREADPSQEEADALASAAASAAASATVAAATGSGSVSAAAASGRAASEAAAEAGKENRVISDDLPLSYRFAHVGSRTDDLDQSFQLGDSCAWRDNKNNFRVLLVDQDGRLSMKTSADAQDWIYIFKDVFAHKNTVSKTPDDVDLGIRNCQVVYDEDTDVVYFMYYYQDALFMRVFPNALLYPGENAKPPSEFIEGEFEDSYSSESIKNVMTIAPDSAHNPIFIVGAVPGEIKDAIEDEDEELLVSFPYPPEQVERFENDFEVDVITKPAGFIMNTGQLRGFYKTKDRQVVGFTFTGYIPYLDVQLKPNPDAVAVADNLS
jgi:hypothetical protein